MSLLRRDTLADDGRGVVHRRVAVLRWGAAARGLAFRSLAAEEKAERPDLAARVLAVFDPARRVAQVVAVAAGPSLVLEHEDDLPGAEAPHQLARALEGEPRVLGDLGVGRGQAVLDGLAVRSVHAHLHEDQEAPLRAREVPVGDGELDLLGATRERAEPRYGRATSRRSHATLCRSRARFGTGISAFRPNSTP
ncbi:MAG: hypothetical protein ACOZNI_21180 [Myxococcota bacterium]